VCRSQQEPLPPRRMKTWYPGIDDEEEMSDPECVESMSVSPYVSDIERERVE